MRAEAGRRGERPLAEAIGPVLGARLCFLVSLWGVSAVSRASACRSRRAVVEGKTGLNGSKGLTLSTCLGKQGRAAAPGLPNSTDQNRPTSVGSRTRLVCSVHAHSSYQREVSKGAEVGVLSQSCSLEPHPPFLCFHSRGVPMKLLPLLPSVVGLCLSLAPLQLVSAAVLGSPNALASRAGSSICRLSNCLAHPTC